MAFGCMWHAGDPPNTELQGLAAALKAPGPVCISVGYLVSRIIAMPVLAITCGDGTMTAKLSGKSK